MQTEKEITARQILEIIPLVMRTVAAELRQTEFTLEPGHFRLLNMLAHHPYNLSELARKHSVSLPTMSNTISTLVERGWVKRERVADNRRMVLIELTPAGREALELIQAKAVARVVEIIDPLSSSECDQVQEGLEILRDLFGAAAECAARKGEEKLSESESTIV